MVIVFGLFLLALAQPAPAAVFNIPSGDVTALLNAINVANANGEDDTINLAAGTYTLTAVHNDTDGPNGLPTITSPIIIKGVSAKNTIIEREANGPPFRIFHVSSAGELALDHVTIQGGDIPGTGPAPFGQGGGLLNLGTLEISNSIITHNRAEFTAGGIRNFFGDPTLIITHSTLSENSADGGGAGIDNDGTLIITNSTISRNDTPGTGGGIWAGGTVILTNSTISKNVSNTGGGIDENVGAITLSHTIIADNVGDNCLFGNVTSLGHNLDSDGTCNLTQPNDLPNTDPFLGPLADNGGPTRTHALLAGSPAIDAGARVCVDPYGQPITTDQRGRSRPVNGTGDGLARCDIGAVEFYPTVNHLVRLDSPPETDFDATPSVGAPAGTFAIAATFTNTSDRPIQLPFFQVRRLSGSHLVLNADDGPGRVGTTVTPELDGDVFRPDETVTVTFLIGLQKRQPFTFFVDLHGVPGPEDAGFPHD